MIKIMKNRTKVELYNPSIVSQEQKTNPSFLYILSITPHPSMPIGKKLFHVIFLHLLNLNKFDFLPFQTKVKWFRLFLDTPMHGFSSHIQPHLEPSYGFEPMSTSAWQNTCASSSSPKINVTTYGFEPMSTSAWRNTCASLSSLWELKLM